MLPDQGLAQRTGLELQLAEARSRMMKMAAITRMMSMMVMMARMMIMMMVATMTLMTMMMVNDGDENDKTSNDVGKRDCC